MTDQGRNIRENVVCPSIFRQKKGGMKGPIRSASVNRARNSRDDIDISRRNNRPFAGREDTIWNDHRYFISEQFSWPIIFEFAPQIKSLVADHITYAKRTLVYVLFPRCVSSSSSFSRGQRKRQQQQQPGQRSLPLPFAWEFLRGWEKPYVTGGDGYVRG